MCKCVSLCVFVPTVSLTTPGRSISLPRIHAQIVAEKIHSIKHGNVNMVSCNEGELNVPEYQERVFN